MTTHTTDRPLAATTRLPDVPQVMRLDALASGALGLGLFAAAPVSESWLGASVAFALTVGVFLVAWAGVVAVVAARPRRGWVREVAALNTVWVLASLGFAALDPVGLTTAGLAVVVAQALAVAGLVGLTISATRRAGAPSIAA